MTLPMWKLQSREYPTLDPVTRQPLSDVFYFFFLSPHTKRIESKSVLLATEQGDLPADALRQIEQEIGCLPSIVSKGLYFFRVEGDPLWHETPFKQGDPRHFEPYTQRYYEYARPLAYPKDGPIVDIFKGQKPVELTQQAVHMAMLERRIRQYQIKDLESAMPFSFSNTSPDKPFEGLPPGSLPYDTKNESTLDAWNKMSMARGGEPGGLTA